MFQSHKLLCAIFMALIFVLPATQALAGSHSVLTYQGVLTD